MRCAFPPRERSAQEETVTSNVTMHYSKGYVSSSTETPWKKTFEFVDSTGYPVLEVNGERLYGPPCDWIGSIPDKGCEVFINGLPRDVFEYDLAQLFIRVGTIYQMRLLMDVCGCNRGCAFVKYTEPSEAKRAVKELDGLVIKPGYRIYVTMYTENCRLIVGKIPRHITEQQLEMSLSEIFRGIENVELYIDVTDKTKNRGFAFVEFLNHGAAAMAIRMAYTYKIKLWNTELYIDWALPERKVSEYILSKIKVLFVRNLSPNITKGIITRAFSRFSPKSEVIKVTKVKHFAFVHFPRRKAAESALRYWNGRKLGDFVIEVMWAKPRDSPLPEIPLNHYDVNDDTCNYSTSYERPIGFTIPINCRKITAAREPSYGSWGTKNTNVNDVQELPTFGRYEERPFRTQDVPDTVNLNAPLDVSSLISQFLNVSIQGTYSQSSEMTTNRPGSSTNSMGSLNNII